MSKKTKRPLLERMGLAYFRARGAASRVDERIHILDDDEQAALKRVERGAIVRAAIAGGLSAAVSGGAEVYADQHFANSPLIYWSILGGVTGLATALELSFLYWDALRSARNLADAAGLQLFEGTPEVPKKVAVALSRAALELPNPTKGQLSGLSVDAHREANKYALVVIGLAYKAKVGVTNFLVKALIRRAMGRVAVRSWLPFVAVPITALWNALVTRAVMREARIRVIGPSAARAFLAALESELSDAGAHVRAVCARGVATAIVRTQDLHPNLEVLLEALLGEELELEDLDASARFSSDLLSLDDEDRDLPLMIFSYALALDGRIHRREIKMWRELMGEVERAGNEAALREITREFKNGQRLDLPRLREAIK